MRFLSWKALLITFACALCYPAMAQIPTGVTAVCEPDGQAVTISWNPVPGASHYFPRLNNEAYDSQICPYYWYCTNTLLGADDWIGDWYVGTSVTRSVTPRQGYGFWVHSYVNGVLSGAETTRINCIPQTAATPVGQISSNFSVIQNGGISQINMDGVNLLTGTGFYVIASRTGRDDTANVNTMAGGLPNTIQFSAGANPLEVRFSGGVSAPNGFALLSTNMALDGNKDIFTHYKYSGGPQRPTKYGSEYNDVVYFEARDVGPNDQDLIGQPVFYDHHNGPTWGEMISPRYTLRVTADNGSFHMPNGETMLSFVTHPRAKSFSFGIGDIQAGHTRSFGGTISVSRTDGAHWFAGQPSGHYLTALHPFHHVGQNAGFSEGWEVFQGQSGFMSYGPYTTSVPHGFRTANFRIKTTNYFPYNDLIVAIEVYDAVTDQFLARREVTRAEFTQGDQYQDFPLNFYSQPGQQLEFRTYAYGGFYVNQLGVYVQ